MGQPLRRKAGFGPSPIPVSLAVDTVAVGQCLLLEPVFSRVTVFPPTPWTYLQLSLALSSVSN